MSQQAFPIELGYPDTSIVKSQFSLIVHNSKLHIYLCIFKVYHTYSDYIHEEGRDQVILSITIHPTLVIMHNDSINIIERMDILKIWQFSVEPNYNIQSNKY